MRVLIISHNVIDNANNMGKTLLSYFNEFSPDEIAEFYIQDKEPENMSICTNYYRVTDRDALKSIIGIKVGNVFKTNTTSICHKENKRIFESVRQYGRKRNGFAYTARNMIWAMSHWKTKEFNNWVKSFNPDIIFFMSGDYSFMYKITYAIKKELNIPLVVCCVDDYYIYNRNEKSLLGRIQYRCFMRVVHKTMKSAFCIFTISDLMNHAYHALFNKKCYTLHTSVQQTNNPSEYSGKKLAYFGNISFGRYQQLIKIGKVVKEYKIAGLDGIDLYTAEKKDALLKDLNENNGIHFKGEISPNEITKRMNECIATIFTESFIPRMINLTKYSVSTKIPNLLLNGPCIIAFGPDSIASIDYLKKNNAAYVITKEKDLASGLHEILTNSVLRDKIVENARVLGKRNHDISINGKKIRNWLQMAIDQQ